MNILVLAQNLDRPETEMLRILSKRDVALHLMSDPACPNVQSLQSSRVTFSPLTFRGRIDRTAIKAIRAAIQHHTPDIIQSLRNNHPLSNALIASAKHKVKHVCYRGTMGNLSRWNPGSWMTYLSPRLDKIWCVSKGVEDYLASMSVPANKLVTIYKGHHPSWYPENPELTRATLGLPETSFLIGTSGTLRPLKGIPVLLKAIRALAADVHGVLVGDITDDEINRLTAEPDLKERITLTGFRPDAPQVMALCDVFVMPSLKREGLPRSMMEAMARGTPVIVSDIGGMAEVVDDGVNGFIVPPGDVPATTAALQTMASDPARCATMGKAALAKINGPLNVQTSAENLLKVYQELCA